jgi:hypothetical protein
VGTEKLAAIAAACPGLKRLVARGSLKASANYSVLSGLQHLTDLVASHVSSIGAAGMLGGRCQAPLLVMQPQAGCHQSAPYSVSTGLTRPCTQGLRS